MAAGVYDIYIEQGATFSLTTTIKDKNGVPIDLTGSTFAGKIRAYPASLTVIAVLVCTPNLANPGELDIVISAANTALIPAPNTADIPQELTQYFYDINWTKPDTTVSRLLMGAVNVSPEVTY